MQTLGKRSINAFFLLLNAPFAIFISFHVLKCILIYFEKVNIVYLAGQRYN